ncbi:MAG: histidine kinase [Eggerthellaceae bacterium]|nr:histidine kinase [Eggerthellaceae bacterium]
MANVFTYPGPSTPPSPGAGYPVVEPAFDYSYVQTPAQIAVYDDFLSEPRVLTVQPAPTTDFIGALANTIYQQAKLMGGTIAYSIILQVTENFIHARFSEMVVSIFNNGKTIRFADQGPGFRNKDQALQPGFSSATQPMKRYIKGVGSGLPTVKEWLQVASEGGRITIEDNLNGGAVVTISVGEEQPTTLAKPKKPVFSLPSLTDKEIQYILLIHEKGPQRITDFEKALNLAKSTIYADLSRLTDTGLIKNEPGTKRRQLTEQGEEAAQILLKR